MFRGLPALHGTRHPPRSDTLFFNIGSPVLQLGFRGTLDANGDAFALIGFPPGLLSGLIGMQLHLAAISLRPGVLAEWSSVAVPLEFVS